MSVICKSSYIYSERKNNVYKCNSGGGDTINFYIPESLAVINTKNTYLVFNLTMTGTQYKACVSQKAGVYSLIRSMQISSGDGSTVFETLDHYAWLQALKYYYEQTETSRNLAVLHEGFPSKSYIDDVSCNQYLNASESTEDDVYQTIEVVAPLYLSGCLYRDQVWPNVATRGLRVKIELNNIDTIMNAVTAPLYKLDNGANVQQSVDGGGYSKSTGYATDEYGANAGDATVSLKPTEDLLKTAESRVLVPTGDDPTHLFMVGQHIRIGSQATDYVISKVDMDGNKHLRLTFSPGLSADVAEDDSVYISSDAAYNDMGCKIESLKMNVSMVDNPKMINDMVGKINSGKMNFDIQTYTDYSRNIANGSLNNTMPLSGVMNTRCKALLTIPQSSHSNSAVTDSFAPAMETPRSYNYLLYNNLLVPDRQVNLKRFTEGNYDAVALREMMLSLHAAGYDVNYVREPHKHFFYGRRLALRNGYSYDSKGAITVNLNYTELSSSLLLHNFLIHKRRIQVKPDGISVVF